MPEDLLAEDLRRVIGQLVRAVRVVDEMPPGEAAILGYLDRGGPHTIAELAQLRRVSHQSAAKSVKELRGNGFVQAEPHPEDGRKVLLRITAAGRTRLRQDRARRADSLAGALQGELTAQERRQLRECIGLLERITERITEG